MKKKRTPEATSSKDYERLGKMLKTIIETGYPTGRQFFMMNFLRGVMVGLGSIIGATIVLSLLLWILSFFESLPLVQPLIDNIREAP